MNLANLGSRLLDDSACILLLFQVLASVGKFCMLLLVLMCSVTLAPAAPVLCFTSALRNLYITL